MPKKVPKEPKPLSSTSASPWDALRREVQVDIGSWDKKVGEITESPVDGQDQPKIYEICDHTLGVLMHPSVLELHSVRVVRTPHGDERQSHLKVRVMCGRKEVIADVLVDTGVRKLALISALRVLMKSCRFWCPKTEQKQQVEHKHDVDRSNE